MLDVGSGCGKLCLVGALSSPATFVGVERRVALVRAAEAVARAFAISRAEFIHSDFPLVSWSDFDAFYFFNPFAEYLYGASHPTIIDDNTSEQPWRFDRAIQIVESRLAALPIGTRVVCYNGYGGDMPKNFHVKQWQKINDCYLRLWVKEARPRPVRNTSVGRAE
ncbi:MAG: methyltransferase domain-containing protein [Deltaproteobacteria bacterium]|nr:methyltransferase domain-containing protein [Deltaproteobacteria bacterium]